MEARKTRKTSLWKYWSRYPYQSGVSLVGTFVGFIVFWRLGYMNDVVAFGCGYVGNSIADMFGKRAETLIQEGVEASGK